MPCWQKKKPYRLRVMKSYQLILLDRDGVINYESADYIRCVSDWVAIPGSLAAIAKLNKQGFKVAVVTNQSGIARGFYDEDDLFSIHEKMKLALAKERGKVDAIFYCPHHPDEQCECRKPKPGLLLQALQHFQVQPQEAILIGDSKRDIMAANQIGCDVILVETGNGKSEKKNLDDVDIPVLANLRAAVKYIIQQQETN